MNICSDGHEEICYESKYCSLCSAIDEVRSLLETIKELREEINQKGMEEIH